MKMTTLSFILKQRVLALCVIAMGFLSGCGSSTEDTAVAVNPDYDIGTTEYSDLAVKSLSAWTQLDIDAWASTMSDDVEYYFPDGDTGTRTSLIGKTAVLDWWNNWKMTSGIQSMSYVDHADIPIVQKTPNPMSGLPGQVVISWFSNELVYSAATVNIRMNVVTYFDSTKLINRFYTYYDRSGILEATNTNVLEN